MKIIFFILIIVNINANSFCQDSINNLNTWSITTSVNVIYPTTKKYHVKSEYTNPSFGYEYDIIPQWSINPRITINYERLIFVTKKSSYSIVAGVGYAQNTYKSINTGWYISDFPPYGNEGTFNIKTKENYVEMNLGLASNIKLNRHFVWNNQVLFTTDLFVRSGYIYFYNTPKSRNYIYYQTGLMFRLFKNLYFTPSIALPFIEILKKNDDFYNSYYNYNKHYGSVMSSFVFTYSKTKKL